MVHEHFNATVVVPCTTWLFLSSLSFERTVNEHCIFSLYSTRSIQVTTTVLERQLRHVLSTIMERGIPRPLRTNTVILVFNSLIHEQIERFSDLAHISFLS